MPLVDADVPGALAAVEAPAALVEAAASSVSRRVGDDISLSEVDEDEDEEVWELPEYGLKIGGDLGLLGSSLIAATSLR